jgi:UDP-N-acetylglucosamine--N-acetylmuramyl-(pentapeptide) pyrophosphoryl-undecaprenol N-acetylglucosamine transferase
MTNNSQAQDLIAILIAAGGTGGGIYPALAVAEALRRVAPSVTLHYVGSVGGMEDKLVPRDLVTSYHAVHAGPVHSVGLPRTLASLAKIAVGTLQALALIIRVRPRVMFMTGGYATLPVAAACWLMRVPIVIFLPDIEPALTIKATALLSRLVLTSTADSAAYFRRGTPLREVGYPLRADFVRATREAGLKHFGLDPARKTLLITGGSRGSRSINEAISAILPDLLAEGVQIVHVSGELDAPQVMARREALPADLQPRYQVFAYLHGDMGLAQAAADLVVSRAGASILGEYPYFGLPAILIPLAFAWRYQRTNAAWLASRGAAIPLDDDQVRAELLPTIRALLHDPARLDAMRSAALALRQADVAEQIAHLLCQWR